MLGSGRAMRRGLVGGALAGLWLAFSDFGALWLWLPVLRDRAWLLLRLLASLVPFAALAGCLLAGLGTALALSVRRPARWAACLTVLASGPLVWLSVRLCSGGKMSKLADRYPLQPVLWGALLCATFTALWIGASSAGALAVARERTRVRTGVVLLLVASLLAKANQLILPNLYDYLHACLALLAFGTGALGFGLLLFRTWQLPRVRRVLDDRRLVAVLGSLLLGVGVANALSLDANLNVRVALFDARSPSSRALLSAIDPWLRSLEQRQRVQPKYSARSSHVLPASAEGAHVLLITIDALRADHLGSYGYTRPVSPKLDQLAARSLRFERAYAQAPHSSYSLSSLHTSEYLHEVVELDRPLPEATLARAFADHGYHTAAFYTSGIFHTEGEKLAPLRDSAFGFALFDQTDRESEQQTDRVLQEVERIKQRGEPPSLLWVHYFDVHEPYEQTTFGTSEVDRYDSEILHVDREVDRLIRELDARLTKPLVIAITADHGEEFRDHGGVYHGSTLYDEQVRVPLILRVPGMAAATVAAPVESIDVAPTLLATVGAPVPASMRGRDLRAVAGEPLPVFSAVLTKRMALKWPYKLIADLRFGLFELYDLARDPHERTNLATQDPAQLDQLRGYVYGWLDSIDDQDRDDETRAFTRALDLGRLGDRRAVEPLCALLLNQEAPSELRVEAGQFLARLADPTSVEALSKGLSTEPPRVAAEAAIALGRMQDRAAQAPLRKLMHAEDPYLRARAAVSLGRLRDPAAVPALIDALWVAPSQYEREEAVRWLGRIGDPRATEPLLSLLSEFKLRYLIVVALGQIGGMSGDKRGLADMVNMLEWESRTNIRDEIVRGLGLMQDPRAIPALLRVFGDAGLKNTAESLVRLNAISEHAIGGVDLSCEQGPFYQDWDYLGRTSCTGPRFDRQLPVQPWKHALLVMRAKAERAQPCELELGDEVRTVALRSDYDELRIPLHDLHDKLSFSLACPGLTLDHVLVVPIVEGVD